MQPGDLLTLHIEKAVAGGRMLARHDGAIVLVAGAIPGEVVEARVEKIQRNTIWAATERVREASPDRVPVEGDWACGGSVYSHVRYERQLDLKRDVLRDGFGRLARVVLDDDTPVIASPVDGYRMRARLHWRNGRLGFFREGSHDLCDAAATRQLLPATIDALARLEQALNQTSAASVREVELSENIPADQRTCHFELNANADPSRLANAQVDGFSGATCGFTEQSRTLTLWGSSSVSDTLSIKTQGHEHTCTIQLRRHARAFFQGNRYLLPELVTQVVDATRPGAIIDLYAGVGLFAVALSACGKGHVVAIEGDRISADDLKQNAAPFHDVLDTRRQSVEAFFAARHSKTRVDSLIVDPPRTGMTRDALRGAIALQAARVIYVSCDVATLARDTRLLLDAHYRMVGLRTFDLFPNTAHVESLAIFDRE